MAKKLKVGCFGVFCAQLESASSMDEVKQHQTEPDHLNDRIEPSSAGQAQLSQLWND